MPSALVVTVRGIRSLEEGQTSFKTNILTEGGGGLTYRWLRIIISVITWYIFCFAASFCGNSSLCILALLMSGTHRHIDKRPCRLANRECHIYILPLPLFLFLCTSFSTAEMSALHLIFAAPNTCPSS